MKKLLVFICAISLVLCVAGTVNAMVINGGFETGFTGWTTYIPPGGSASVVTSHTGDLGTLYDPVEGDYFALLKTGGLGSYTTLSQDIYLGEDVLEGWAAFDYRDYYPYNDNAYVKIYSGSSLIATPWSVFGNSVPNYWDRPWTEWSWTAASADTYTLKFGVANSGDCDYDSYALFDANVHQSSAAPVPEPFTILLVGTGLIGIIGFGRKRLNKKA